MVSSGRRLGDMSESKEGRRRGRERGETGGRTDVSLSEVIRWLIDWHSLALPPTTGPHQRGEPGIEEASKSAKLKSPSAPPAALQKLNSLRVEADAAIERAEEAESKNKRLEQDSLQKEQEITSLQHKLSLMETELEKAEGKLQDHKVNAEEQDSSKSNVDNLSRKITMLEDELDATEKNLRETTEK